MTQLAQRDTAPTIEKVLIEGDLSRLTSDQKVAYYMRVCESLGLNPYTKPFDYLKLNGREILYARKDATDQLRKAQRVSITSLDRQRLDDLYVVTATARTGDGRSDSSVGAVWVKGLAGEALANALMKAETKAKRRVTLSICGLGMTDDSEIEAMPGAQREDFDLPRNVDLETGEVIEAGPPYVPIREQDVDDADIVRNADDVAWQSWLKVMARALDLGVSVQQIRLPVARHELKATADDAIAAIRNREHDLARQDKAVAAGHAAS